jgi:hypothetical protein
MLGIGGFCMNNVSTPVGGESYVVSDIPGHTHLGAGATIRVYEKADFCTNVKITLHCYHPALGNVSIIVDSVLLAVPDALR